MKYVTYENRSNKHVNIHKEGCKCIKMHGGDHKKNQGEYHYFDTFEDAKKYAKQVSDDFNLPLGICKKCKSR
jgi:hypothetical protein